MSSEPHLLFRRIARLGFGVYAARVRAKKPRIESDSYVIFDESVGQQPHDDWLATHAPRARIALRSNRPQTLIEAVRRGIGLGILPCVAAEDDQALVRVLGPTEVSRVTCASSCIQTFAMLAAFDRLSTPSWLMPLPTRPRSLAKRHLLGGAVSRLSADRRGATAGLRFCPDSARVLCILPPSWQAAERASPRYSRCTVESQPRKTSRHVHIRTPLRWISPCYWSSLAARSWRAACSRSSHVTALPGTARFALARLDGPPRQGGRDAGRLRGRRGAAERLSPSAGINVVQRVPVAWGAADHYVGVALAAAGDLDGASAFLEDAVRLHTVWGAGAFRAASQAELASVLRRRGKPGDRVRVTGLEASVRSEAARLGIARRSWRVSTSRGPARAQ